MPADQLTDLQQTLSGLRDILGSQTRLAETGDDLMSQPTLSRLENAPSWRELARMGCTKALT